MIIVIRCTSILLMTVIVVMVSSESDNYNEKEFKQLCNILRVAEGEPKKIPDELAKFSETRNVLEKLLRVTRTSTSTYQKVVQLKSSDKEDADFKSYTVKRKTANAKIQHAMEKTNEIFSRIEEELIQANKERMLARNSLAHAIYGVQVGELPKEKDIPDVLKNVSRGSISNHHGGEKKVKYHDTSKEPACGGAGESGAGFTLINDFYCLCVGKDNEKAVCHDKIRGPGKWEPEECKDCKDCCKDMSCCCCCGDNCNKCKCEKCNCKVLQLWKWAMAKVRSHRHVDETTEPRWCGTRASRWLPHHP
ncbi:unnamed protein product [Trypanosoma congolense IL3000]|uniref:WGS project CAEQ00000000 data, annotated contig 1418 n=1 Tax=Trypanosoma congolense (strain IL3000) TaxID=1068625 RepID=F9W630_TRYCI|nr:unnamed protein product [Trypanosoma congolense IL3000]